jgi:hypothetical protein
MRRNLVGWCAGVFATLALGLTFTDALVAQTSTTTSVDVRNFEVIQVEGNQLVVRDERGTNEYTVPDDFRFTVDGKKMSVSELKPGMKGTATVTTTTTIKPVVITEIRQGTVLDIGPGSLTVRDEGDGLRKRFTLTQLNDRGIQILKDGKVVHLSQINKGDVLTATVVSQGPPVVVTEQEVQATLAKTPATPAPTAATPAPADATTAKTDTTVAAAQPATPSPSSETTPAPATSAPVEPTGMGMTGYLLIAVLIGVVLFLVARRRKDKP